jgi:putative membrane-bound dehydrogenase-like protein
MKSLRLYGLGLSLAVAIGLPAAQFKFPDRNITVPDGFTVELVASAPLVNRPVSIAYDEQGRLYATDSSGSSDKGPTQYERKDHRIVRLEDTDGDGKFDKSVIFADKMMFPEGAMFYEGSLYVAAPPQIWKLTDTDRDGVADKRDIWHDGKTLTGCANDLHGPYLGPDGWIYWTKGAFAEQRYTLHNGKPFVTRASHIFRARPDGTGIEPVLTGGMDNPVGVTFTSTGERFLSCTFVQPGGGKRDGLLHAVYGGVYGKEQAALEGHPRTGDLMPVMNHSGASAPCGLTTYRSRTFGADWFDNLLCCYFNLHKVVRHELIPDGATFKTKDTDLISSDSQDFHPTDVLEDADGSVLVVDTGGWYKICCPTSQLAKPDVLGGIYRIRKTGAPKVNDPRGLKVAWAKMKPPQLVKLLGDGRLYVRTRAIHELGKRGTDAVPAILEAYHDAELVPLGKTAQAAYEADPAHWDRLEMARNAIWALTRIDSPIARDFVRRRIVGKKYLRPDDIATHSIAIHSASLWRDTSAVERLLFHIGNITQPSKEYPQYPQLPRAAAEALGRLGDKSAVPVLLAAADKIRGDKLTLSDGDRVLEHSLISAVIEIGNHDSVPPSTTLATFSHAGLIALDQMDGGGLKPEQITPLLTSFNPLHAQTASWIVRHHPDWGEALVSFYRERLAWKSLSNSERAELQSQLTQLAKAPAIQELLAATVNKPDANGDAQLLVLRAMAGAGLKETPARWFTEMVALLSASNAELLRQAIATARTLPLPKQGNPELTTALAKVGHNSSAPADVRLDALSAAGGLSSVEPALFDFLCANLDGKQPMLVRSAAASVLAKAKLSPDQQLALAGQMKTVGPLEAPKLLPAFERGANEALGLKLLTSLKDSAGFRGLRVDLLKPLLAKYPKPVQEQGAELITLLNADVAKQATQLEELLIACKDGDVRRGQALFNSTKSACSTCHSIGYQGGKLGPDLTRIGQARNQRDLLESIVFPNASFVRSYEPFTVVTKAGDDFTGIIKKDAPDEVVLATGPETEQRVARADIAEMRPGAVSIMPQGLDQLLTKQELADLLAFLVATKW